IKSIGESLLKGRHCLPAPNLRYSFFSLLLDVRRLPPNRDRLMDRSGRRLGAFRIDAVPSFVVLFKAVVDPDVDGRNRERLRCSRQRADEFRETVPLLRHHPPVVVPHWNEFLFGSVLRPRHAETHGTAETALLRKRRHGVRNAVPVTVAEYVVPADRE